MRPDPRPVASWARARGAGCFVAAALACCLLVACKSSLVPWPEDERRGGLGGHVRLPSTLFVRPVAMTDPCAPTVMAAALGISRRGYRVLALPPDLPSAFEIQVACSERVAPVGVLRSATEDDPGPCVAQEVAHLGLDVWVLGPSREDAKEAPRFGPISFRGRQRIYPDTHAGECRFTLEKLPELRKRAGEAVGWRFPPGEVEAPGVDPRILTKSPDAAAIPSTEPDEATP